MTPRSLSRKISGLRVKAPITVSYAHALTELGIWSDEGVWYGRDAYYAIRLGRILRIRRWPG
jgi:hypothetical protein